MIQYWHEKHRELRRQRDDEGFDGFTLIELLIVIVVLGILAATVIFALGGVTGQSTAAACNSDAKTAEVAVQAYIASPDNATNTPPTNISNLYSVTFPGASHSDTFMTKQSNNGYTIELGGDGYGSTGSTSATALSNADGVYVAPAGTAVGTGSPTTWVLYDDPTPDSVNPCNQTPIT